jgi:hypothetical protein
VPCCAVATGFEISPPVCRSSPDAAARSPLAGRGRPEVFFKIVGQTGCVPPCWRSLVHRVWRTYWVGFPNSLLTECSSSMRRSETEASATQRSSASRLRATMRSFGEPRCPRPKLISICGVRHRLCMPACRGKKNSRHFVMSGHGH